MTIAPKTGSVVADPDQQVSLSTLFSIPVASGNPTYLILTGLDRDEYTAGYSTGAMGRVSGNHVTQNFGYLGGDAFSIGIVFTYQASTGLYYNPSYGYFNQLTFTASSEANDNVSLSVFTTDNYSLASAYANNPYVLIENPGYFAYGGSVSVVTQPAAAGHTSAQATPDQVCAAALSFVGDAWNQDGCWVLASNIAAEAGASLPLTSTLIGVPGVANGEWIVAYDGPVSANGNWESKLVAGEMVAFETASGGGHITTVVSGSGASAMLIDNITYVNQNGGIVNPANDGSASDIIVAAPHPAMQEFGGVNPAMAVVYELDAPVVSDTTAAITVIERTSRSLASLFTATNPLAGQAIREWQVYDTDAADSIAMGGAVMSGHTAGNAVTAASLGSVALDAGAVAGSDTIEVRAYNGNYWGDWQSLSATIAAPTAAPPSVTDQTPNQTWQQGQRVSVCLPANTFTDPQNQALTYTATQANGQALPAWLSFSTNTRTFSGTVPSGVESLSLKVTATDTSSLSASETFAITVPALAPMVSHPTSNQRWTAGASISLALATNAFTDPQNEALTYSATQANGQALPAWLGFNSRTETFTGTAPATAQSVSIKVTATDSGGLATSESFSAAVQPAVPAPKPAISVTDPTPTQTWTDGQAVAFTLPANTFKDALGEKMTFAAYEVGGPNVTSWLRFNPTTDELLGTVPATAGGTVTLAVLATDAGNATAMDIFNVNLAHAASHVVSGRTVGGAPGALASHAGAESFVLHAL